MNDLQFGLPVGVRDRLFQQGALSEHAAALPKSDVGRAHFYTQQELCSGNNDVPINIANVASAQRLKSFSQSLMDSNTVTATPSSSSIDGSFLAVAAHRSSLKGTAFRNLPRLCSFWVLGTCQRVARQTCPFRPCCGSEAYAFPEIARSHRELCTVLIDALRLHGPAKIMQTLDEETRTALKMSQNGVNRSDAILKRVQGEDDLSKDYVSKISGEGRSTVGFEASNSTIWVGNIDISVNEKDILAAFYPYGLVTEIYVSRSSTNSAFVKLSCRAEAENALESLRGTLFFHGKLAAINWARPRKESFSETSPCFAVAEECMPLLPPPGFEKASSDMYALPVDFISAAFQ